MRIVHLLRAIRAIRAVPAIRGLAAASCAALLMLAATSGPAAADDGSSRVKFGLIDAVDVATRTIEFMGETYYVNDDSRLIGPTGRRTSLSSLRGAVMSPKSSSRPPDSRGTVRAANITDASHVKLKSKKVGDRWIIEELVHKGDGPEGLTKP